MTEPKPINLLCIKSIKGQAISDENSRNNMVIGMPFKVTKILQFWISVFSHFHSDELLKLTISRTQSGNNISIRSYKCISKCFIWKYIHIILFDSTTRIKLFPLIEAHYGFMVALQISDGASVNRFVSAQGIDMKANS